MSDQHRVDEGPSKRFSEDISDGQPEDYPAGSSQNNGSEKFHQDNEEKPDQKETGKGKAKLDSIGAEPLLSPGIQTVGVEGDRDVKKSMSDVGVKTGNDPLNYEEKYPEDKIYEETAPNARVWRTYVDESTNHDRRMVAELKDTVDVLLVFVGLFSTVATTFLSQTSQNLQTDYAQVLASLLFKMVLIQRAVANGSSLDNVPTSLLSLYSQFTPATTDVWVNGLWLVGWLVPAPGPNKERPGPQP